jgi:P4 family phage/plasmid primase-like protien
MSEPIVDADAIPDELKERDQWLLWDSSNDTPKRPHWRGDFQISWSDPADWQSFETALSAAQERDSWGIGYVMAQGNDEHARGLYACLDLDGCLQDRTTPKDWLPSLQAFIDAGAYIEYSPSGDGLHIPLVGQDIPEWWRDSDLTDAEHEGVDVLENKFCTFTGDVLEDLEPTGVADISPAPFLNECYKALNGDYPEANKSESDSGDTDGDWDREQIEEALSHLDSACGYPQWRDIAFAVHDWDAGTTGQQVFEQWSRGSGWDEQSQRYIEKIWNGAAQGDGITVGTLIHLAQEAGWQPSGRDSPTPDTGESVEPDSGDEDGVDDWAAIRQQLREATDADERAMPRFNAAMRLINKHDFLTLAENDQLYAYKAEKGIFDDTGEAVVRRELTNGLEEQYRAHAMNEALDHIRGRTMVSQEEVGGEPGLIAAKNCVIDLKDMDSLEHSPDYKFLSRLGAEFDPQADAPRFQAFLGEVVPKESDRKKLQEYAGYTLMHWALPYHKALFLVGPTASGKSTFLDTINEMLGDDTVASLTPQQLTGERFSGAELFGKWANIRNDIPASTVENTGMFKEIVGGDSLKAERKRKDPFFFQPKAKHLFAANELPSTETDDEAFYRRILLVPFPETVPAAERDKHLDEKLQAELPGVLNWALRGLERLRKQGGFTGDRTPAMTQETWQKWADSVSRFEKAALTDGDEPLPKSDVYAAYIEYCRQEGIPSDTQHKMTRQLKLEGWEDGKSFINGAQQRCFQQAQFTSRGKQLLEDARAETDNVSEQQRRDTGLGDY